MLLKTGRRLPLPSAPPPHLSKVFARLISLNSIIIEYYKRSYIIELLYYSKYPT
jgi:hypothetical protein